MNCAKLITFNFVEGNYVLKMTAESQASKSKFVYRTEMNVLSFPKFTAMDFNLFFTICYYASSHFKKYGMKQIIRNFKNEVKRGYSEDNDENFVEIKFSDLKVFLPKIKNTKRFYKEILDFSKYKLRFVGVDRVRYTLGKNDKNKIAPFFYEILVDEEEELLKVKLTSYAYSMLNDFGNFMSFDMNEFCSLENKYTKSLFRLLKQYENLNSCADKKDSNVREVSMSKDEFAKFMDTPSDYNVNDLERKVINPSIKEIITKNTFNGSVNKVWSIQNIDYERIFEELDKDKTEENKKRKVKGFKFIFEKKK